MHQRNLLILGKVSSFILVLLLIALILPAGSVLAKDPPGQLKFKDKITPVEKKAAAALFNKQFQTALAAGTATLTATPDPGGVPHYFGPYPNWANSPLPRGVIASITLDAGGSGYTAATVNITDLYYGTNVFQATATATVAGGAVTGITLVTPGSGYSAPVVTITGDGVDAMATATIGPPFTGGLRKFVDSLPGLGTATGLPNGAPNANKLGQYIPVAIADNVACGGSDYYEIAVVEFSEKMHTDLANPTRQRGYVQLETPFNAAVSNHIQLFYPDGNPIYYPNTTNPVYAVAPPHFLGPAIVAQTNKPVRVKFYNL